MDSSVLVAIALGEAGSDEVRDRLLRFSRLCSSNLLEAEMRSALAREGVAFEWQGIGRIRWIHPERPLSEEIGRVLGAGYLRGADLWHLATALSIAHDPTRMSFITLDERQRDVAMRLGFRV